MENESLKYWTDDPELVEKYVLGQITEEEKLRLDREIAECEPCRAKLHEEMELAAGIRRYGRDTMKAQLRTKLRRMRGSQFSSYQYIGLAAAVVIIALGIGVYKIWFGDLTAPKHFGQKEIVLQPQEDTTEVDGELQSSGELPTEQNIAEQKVESAPLQPPVAARAEKIETEVSSSAPRSVSQTNSAAGAALADEVVMKDESKGPDGSSAIWLIGKVVMISGRTIQPSVSASKMEMSKRADIRHDKEKASETAAAEKSVDIRQARNEGIILQQRAIKDLPPDLAGPRDAKERDVQTLLERSEHGISLTLFGDAVNESDLQQAVVETLTDDSLVVSLPNQRIAFRLPSGWNRQATRNR